MFRIQTLETSFLILALLASRKTETTTMSKRQVRFAEILESEIPKLSQGTSFHFEWCRRSWRWCILTVLYPWYILASPAEDDAPSVDLGPTDANDDDISLSSDDEETEDDDQDNSEENNVDPSRESTFVDFLDSAHGEERRKQRQISKADLQAAMKYGKKQSGLNGRIIYKLEGLTLVYDLKTKQEVTSWTRPRNSPSCGDLGLYPRSI